MARTLFARRRTIPAIAVPLMLAACNVGLDPRHFERIDYGDDRPTIEAELETTAEPVLRFFLREPDGRIGDYQLLGLRAFHPHPNYAALMQDGKLVGLRIMPSQRFPSLFEPEPTWSSADMRDTTANWIAHRPSLRWEDLEPLDAASPKQTPHPTWVAIENTIVWLYGGGPFAEVIHELIGPDLEGTRQRLVDGALALPPAATLDQVFASLGPPTTQSPEDDRGVTVCHWEVRSDNTIFAGVLAGFEAGHVVWIDLTYCAIPDPKPTQPDGRSP